MSRRRGDSLGDTSLVLRGRTKKTPWQVRGRAKAVEGSSRRGVTTHDRSHKKLRSKSSSGTNICKLRYRVGVRDCAYLTGCPIWLPLWGRALESCGPERCRRDSSQ